MSLILTPPPTVMVFFKEISLKNESTGRRNAVLKICIVCQLFLRTVEKIFEALTD